MAKRRTKKDEPKVKVDATDEAVAKAEDDATDEAAAKAEDDATDEAAAKAEDDANHTPPKPKPVKYINKTDANVLVNTLKFNPKTGEMSPQTITVPSKGTIIVDPAKLTEPLPAGLVKK